MRSIRLGPRVRFGRGGEERAGRVVNGTVGQVVPKGTVRSIMYAHRHDLRRAGDDTASDEIAHRAKVEAEEARVPSMPDSWSVERGRRQLLDLVARAKSH